MKGFVKANYNILISDYLNLNDLLSVNDVKIKRLPTLYIKS